jgi:hypothetical protein
MNPIPRYPVYIPSKGRANKAKTAGLLEESGVPFLLVVEPQDYEAYSEVYGPVRVISMDRDDPGSVVYARNWIDTHARLNGHPRHWQIDDDMRRVVSWKGGKRTSANIAHAMSTVEQFVEQYSNIVMASLRTTNFGGGKPRPVEFNRMVYGFMLRQTFLPYEWRLPGSEDVDMSLQVLTAGYCTAVFNAFQFETASQGTNAGGHEYQNDVRLAAIRELQRTWPKLVGLVYRNGRPRPDTSKVWRKFPQEPEFV